MGKRCRYSIYTGVYNSHMPVQGRNQSNITRLVYQTINYFYSINVHYMALVTVVLVVLLSFILPDISQKIHRTTQLKAIRQVIDQLSKEVSRAEVACLTIARQLGCLQCDMKNDSMEIVKHHKDLAVCTTQSMCTNNSVAPAPVETKMGFLRRMFLPNKNASVKEITIMSYLYTHSFDAVKKATKLSNQLKHK